MFQKSAKDLMRKDPIIIPANHTLKEAAEKMVSLKCGVLLVGTSDKLEGVITDRDIVVRAVAKGKDASKEQVKDYMTPEICLCNEDDTPDHAAGLMRERGISRIVVQDKNGKTCGILTFGHIIRKNSSMSDIALAIECAVGRKAA